MADLSRLLRAGGGAYTTATLKRYVEETTEPILEQGIRGALNHNQALKGILKKLIDDRDSRVSAAAFISMVGALAAEYGDDLWPHRKDAFTRALRFGLKSMAPVMHFASEVSADAIQNALGPEVDKQFAVDPTFPKGLAEGVFGVFVHTDGKRYPLVYDGKVDTLGDPIPKNPEVFDLWLDQQYLESKTREVRNSGKGGGTRTVTDPPKQRTYILGLDAATMAAMVTTQPHIDPAHLERLEALLKPTASWESQISPKVDEVLSWINDAISLDGLDLTVIKRDRQEIEDLLSSMKREKPDPDWVNRRLGRFAPECKKLKVTKPQPLTADELGQVLRLIDRICNEIDHTLEGEQSNLTKAKQVLRVTPSVLAQGREVVEKQLPWIKTVGAWWLLSAVFALVALVLGLLLPVEGTPILAPSLLVLTALIAFVNMGPAAESFEKVNRDWFWGKFKNQLAWMFLAIAVFLVIIAQTSVPMWQVGLNFSAVGSLLGFVFTWNFKVIQQVIDILRKWIPGLTQEGVADLGRRIALFSMSTGGILAILNWMQMDSYARVLFVAMVFMSMGTLFGYTILDRKFQGDQVAMRALIGLNWVTTPMMLLLFCLSLVSSVQQKPMMTGPEFFRTSWSLVHNDDPNAWDLVQWWNERSSSTSSASSTLVPAPVQTVATPTPASTATSTGTARGFDGNAMCRDPNTTYAQKQILRLQGFNCP